MVSNAELKKLNHKIEILTKRVARKNEHITRYRYELFKLNQKIYAQNLRYSKEKTIVKKKTYEKVMNNIVHKGSELLDIPRYHMALVELSQVFGKPEMFIILLLWASRYDHYSKKDFETNFKNSPLKFLKYNNMLMSEGYINKWEMRRNTYFVSAKGKDMVDKINKFVNKRVNG